MRAADPRHRRRRPVRRRLALAAATLLAAGAPAVAGEAPVEIRVSFERRAHHEAQVSVVFDDLPVAPLEVRMSRSSPGRYALHEFAKNVYSVAAYDRRGEPLPIERPDAHQWTVGGHGGLVRFEYTLFGDRTDGTYAAIDETHAHLNVPASFAWARGLERRGVRVTFELPAGWRVASQLVPTESPATWTAPDLQYFMDSPIEISDHQLVEWTVPGPAASPQRRQTVRLAIHHLGSEEEARAFARVAAAVADEQIAIFGEPPAFDFGVYTFLADYLPWASGDGMEHRNSTVLTSSSSLAGRAVGNLGTLSHELFHAWNIERIRPRSLEPFDFERANVSGELWFGEGFTSYYDDLVLRRAGAISLQRYVDGLSELLSLVLSAPARAYGGPVEMSRQAPFVDAASWIDPSNRANTFVSYYSYGAVLGLGLDLELRTRFQRTLDDYMRAVWLAHGRTEIPYRLEDLERILGEIAGDPEWAADFFRRSAHGSELPDYARLLAAAGLLLRPQRPGEAWLGSLAFDFDPREGIATLDQPALVGSPLYRAGIDRGDVIVEVDGVAAGSRDAFAAALAAREPGDTLTLRVRERGLERDVAVTLAEDPAAELVTFESAGRAVSPEAERVRAEWLGPKAIRHDLRRYCPEDGEAHPFAYEHCPWHGEPLALTPPGRDGQR
ncbi:MAG TPA: PDZ domain-containing protein [Thermoanaerobaculia bacterium]|nr:PDZ domain-containing protein [Thermoanaerobaculia bacterium]